MSQNAVAYPKSVLRGHRAAVHVTTFIKENERLASGDADGFVVLWDLTIMRPRAVWQAHANAILGICGWADDKIITQGRDNKLVVWKITAQDEETLSIALPLDESVSERPQPWILYILEINTMNFCSFATCPALPDTDYDTSNEILIAVPNTLASENIDIYQLPKQQRLLTISFGDKTGKLGMAMALSLFWFTGRLHLVAGYENGQAIVYRRGRGDSWDCLYKCQAHSQPVLSLDVHFDKTHFFTSSADALVVKHPIPNLSPPVGSAEMIPEDEPLKKMNTKHAGQQGLRIRSDGRIFATAGWDSKIRVYSTKTMAELAVLKWHDVGCYAVAFAAITGDSIHATNKLKADSRDHDQAGTQNEVDSRNQGTSLSVLSKPGELSVKDRRIKEAKEAHWVAAGSKDGKISLWDIY
ncbi:WD40 repeat-like protein [Xylariaceae sp. FL1272]|nr:WD40 repeat-like protein [Xylariaceae sp. FL1272]